MRKLIVGLVFAAMTLTCHAQLDTDAAKAAGFNDLSEQAKAEIVKTITDKAAEQVKLKAALPAVPVTEKVDKWVGLGERIGQMLGGAAKELGIAVNDFLKTPAGQWTLVLIVWNYMGGVIVHVMGSVLILLVGLITIYWVFRRAALVEIEYDNEHKNWIGRPVYKTYRRAPLSDDNMWGVLISTALLILLSIWVMFSY